VVHAALFFIEFFINILIKKSIKSFRRMFYLRIKRHCWTYEPERSLASSIKLDCGVLFPQTFENKLSITYLKLKFKVRGFYCRIAGSEQNKVIKYFINQATLLVTFNVALRLGPCYVLFLTIDVLWMQSLSVLHRC